jgi:hypothetical protein
VQGVGELSPPHEPANAGHEESHRRRTRGVHGGTVMREEKKYESSIKSMEWYPAIGWLFVEKSFPFKADSLHHLWKGKVLMSGSLGSRYSIDDTVIYEIENDRCIVMDVGGITVALIRESDVRCVDNAPWVTENNK